MNISLSQPSLLEYLIANNFDASIQNETNQIGAYLQVEREKFPFFARPDEKNSLLQLFIFLPYALPFASAPDVARLLHYYNKEIDLPGFGMDEIDRMVFYRCVLAGKNGHIDKELLDKVLNALRNIAEAFFPSIALVIAGKVSFESVLKKAKEGKKKG